MSRKFSIDGLSGCLCMNSGENLSGVSHFVFEEDGPVDGFGGVWLPLELKLKSDRAEGLGDASSFVKEFGRRVSFTTAVIAEKTVPDWANLISYFVGCTLTSTSDGSISILNTTTGCLPEGIRFS